MEFNINKEEEVKPKSKLTSITPLKDFAIRFNEYSYDLKKGVKCDVHSMFLPNLKTEKVIKN